MDEYEARAWALCELNIIPVFVEQCRFVYTDKATYIFVGNVAIESPRWQKPPGMPDRVISSLGRENEGFLTHFTQTAALTRSSCRRYFVDHQGRGTTRCMRKENAQWTRSTSPLSSPFLR